MKISIITATFNSENYIHSNLDSINRQSHKNYEHIIIDNKSSDNTLDIIKKNGKNLIIKSQNDLGIYDAFNKGIEIASGDIISILNSDDFYYSSETLKDVIEIFMKQKVDIVYGNLDYVKRNKMGKIVRYWKSNAFTSNSFKIGWSPPHPTFFVKKNIYTKFGNFDIKNGNSSDFELMFRFLEKNKISSFHLNKTLVTMRTGGKSNKNINEIIKQNLKILQILDIKFNLFHIIKFLIYKLINRVKQFLILK
tara:strand:+ start:8574 stop:9326 length:753 start_codon:yes stop_codon:yes gene_type:complete